MDGSTGCECTNATCEDSTLPSTPAEWIACMRAGLAKTLASPEVAAVLTANDRAYGRKSCAVLAHFDRNTSSWKTAQLCLFEDLGECLEIWPAWGMTRDGVCSELPRSVPRTYAPAGGDSLRWPTLRRMDGHEGAYRMDGDRMYLTLVGAVRAADRGLLPTLLASDSRSPGPDSAHQGGPKLTALLPTLNARDHKGAPGTGTRARGGRMASLPTLLASDWRSTAPMRNPKNSRPLRESLRSDGGTLNPTWCEWFMGWPLGSTASRLWATGKSRSKPQPLGACSEDREDE
jgi:hypothetical protein